MPELPEVETIRCGLEPVLVGQVFSDVMTDSKKHINLPIAKFRKSLIGKKILSVNRRAKMLYFILSGDYFLAVHLKMTGQLVYRSKKKTIHGGHPIKAGEENLPNKFTREIFKFKSGNVLYFNDTRKFGWARLLDGEGFKKLLEHSNYGLEPLGDNFTIDYLRSILKRYPRKKVKVLLMDQNIIAGLGNIYCDEVLFYSKIKPNRLCKKLSQKEVELLFKGIKTILPKAIECGGSSIASHLDAHGRKGSYSKYHKVYALYGTPCPRCKAILQKMKIGGRTSTFCPKCQR